MCHGVDPRRKLPLTLDRFETYFRIASEMGFRSISYDDLEAWFTGRGGLPERPILFDIDHPEKTGELYWADGRLLKSQELLGAPGPDEPDGGPAQALRYITRQSDPYRLPSVELGYLIYDYAAYRRYLEGALAF
jgi:hypothetical protein